MSLVRTTAGLLHADDFSSDTRADYTFIGSSSTPTSMQSGYLRLEVPDNQGILGSVNAVAVGECFAQAVFRWPFSTTNALATLRLRMVPDDSVGLSLSSDDYFLIAVASTSQVELKKVVGGTESGLDAAAASFALNTDFLMQLYVADGLQEGYGAGGSVSAADTAHDGQDERSVGFSGIHFSNSDVDVGGLLYCRTKTIEGTGLGTGQKLKVFDSGDSQVFSATESGGTATINASHFDGATADVPVGGWAYATVTDSGDTELARFDDEPVYPGDVYEFTGAVASGFPKLHLRPMELRPMSLRKMGLTKMGSEPEE